MNSNTLARRRIPAIESQPVRQLNGQRAQICDPGVVIAFQHRGGFATLLVNNHEQNSKMRNGKDDNSLVYCQPYGVLYTVTDHQLKALETFEIGYCIKEMRVKILDSMSNETDIYVTACVFVSTGWTMLHKPMPPTERYRNILLQGATEHHLPAHYLHWLSKIPTVNTTSAVHLPGYDDTLGKVAAKLFALSCAVLVMFFSVRVER